LIKLTGLARVEPSYLLIVVWLMFYFGWV